MHNKNISIIGAGIGGLTAGALLTKKGYKVTIFEKESRIGGRALTFNGSSVNLEEYKQLLARYRHVLRWHLRYMFAACDSETEYTYMC